MDFRINSITSKSRYHAKNEDGHICDERFIVIADGMGGEACGDVASGITIKKISDYLRDNLRGTETPEEVRTLAFEAISKADEAICEYVASHPEADGMGTTVVLLIRCDHDAYVVWCGDSRCYHYKPGKDFTPLTSDHSYVQELIDRNVITVEESFSHPDNNLLTRYIGGGQGVCVPEFASLSLTDNSIVVMCSDGLSGYCRDEEIKKEVEDSDADKLHEHLMRLAQMKGSDDDITIVTLTPKTLSQLSGKSFFERIKNLFSTTPKER